jgi:hypothetical protein
MFSGLLGLGSGERRGWTHCVSFVRHCGTFKVTTRYRTHAHDMTSLFVIYCFTVGKEVSVSVIVMEKAVGEEEGRNLQKCRGPSRQPEVSRSFHDNSFAVLKKESPQPSPMVMLKKAGLAQHKTFDSYDELF